MIPCSAMLGSYWPIAQVSPMTGSNWRRTGRRNLSYSEAVRGGVSLRVQPLLLRNTQQVHGVVRHHQHELHHHHYHQQRQHQRRTLAHSPLSRLNLGHIGLVYVAARQSRPHQTRAVFSTADIRQALVAFCDQQSQHQCGHFVPPSSVKTTVPRRDETLDWTDRGLVTATATTATKRPELSPLRMATTKFNSSDSEQAQQQSEKNDLRLAPNGGGNGHLELKDCGLASAIAGIAHSAPLIKSPSDGQIMSCGKRGIRLKKSCLLSARRWREARGDREERTCSRSVSSSKTKDNKPARCPLNASYANGRHQSSQDQSVSEISEESNNDKQERERTRTKCQDEQPKTKETTIETEAMTTGSFVPTDSLSNRQQQISNVDLDQEGLSQQQSQFSLSSHQQSARPIGLGCSGSTRTSSSSLSSADQDQSQDFEPRDQQRQHLANNRDSNNNDDDSSNKNSTVNNMNQGGEKYTIISSSSVVSLSNESDRAHHYGQSTPGVGGHSAMESSSTNALNQRSANGGKHLIGKFVGKKASRIRELLLQNLGRADRTTDELFDLYEMNFYKQQQNVQQLTKEFKLYTNALKSYQEAGRSLNKCIQQSTSDYQLARHDLICDSLPQLDQLNEDLMEKLHEKVIKSLGDYLAQFEEIKDKINKRHRKLIDYDSSRRLYELMFARVNKKRSNNAQQQQQQQSQQPQNYQSILRGLKFLSQQQQQPANGHHSSHQESASQLVDEARLLKLREQFNYCKLMYETINGELHDELPIVYEKKMKSLLNALQNFYDISAHYHSNAGKLIAKVSDVMVVARPQTGGEEPSNATILSMYDESADEKQSPTRREIIAGAGSGSSGVSLSGSASRSSGSSLASPDCDDQHRRQMGNNNRNDEDDDDYEQQQGSKNVERPADLEGFERQYVEVSLESAGGQADDSPSASALDGAAAATADKLACVGLDDDEEQQTSMKPVEDEEFDGEELLPEKVSLESAKDLVGIVKIERGPAIGETNLVNSQVPVIMLGEAADKGNSDSDTNGEPKEYLYRVRTNYKYLAEDVDELCFEANEIIQVIEFDENHEPEDGWLLGIREVNNQRGLFPANFTQPI